MSNHPPTPSLGEPANYAQQWHPSHPAQSASTPALFQPHIPFTPDLSLASQQPQNGTSHSFDYHNMGNFHANSRLPGLGGHGAGGPLPPPPFPFMAPFTPSSFPPPPFLSTHMPPLTYPPIPFSVPPLHGPSRPSTGDFQSQANSGRLNAIDCQTATTSSSRQDFDREEGELTDREGASSTQSKNEVIITERRPDTGPTSSTRQSGYTPSSYSAQRTNVNKYLGKDLMPKDSRARSSDIEEGEASSSELHPSTRDSGSPYNPPISVNLDPLLHKHTMEPETPPRRNASHPPSRESDALHNRGESLAQLRVKAQGALLSLVPHNIRYTELVGEDINPIVLRQLYEEVGIKVATPQPDTLSSINNLPSKSPVVPEKSLGATHELSTSSQPLLQQATEPKHIEVPKAVPASTQPNTAKPLERKEVIARMLAAKAAKAAKPSGVSSPPQTDVSKAAPLSESTSSGDVDGTTPVTPAQETPAKANEGRVKEKNKAQTELARQRIEQLKKQGLMRSQQKLQPGPVLQEKVPESNAIGPVPVPHPFNPLTIQHPLPDRPPEPEPAASARIPGLFMTELEQTSLHDSYVTPVQDLIVDSTPQRHVNQRKRPRASDFDEPVLMSKRSFNGMNNNAPENRLIIDISDDEFYGDDENDDMEIETGTQQDAVVAGTGLPLRPFPPSTDSLSQRSAASNQAISTSTTPQSSRNTDQEHLRQKDLAIKAMRRRIAELEQRKKAKLAESRTQSPRAIDLPTSSLAGNSSAADTEANNLTDSSAESAISRVHSQTPLIDTVSELVSANQAPGSSTHAGLPATSSTRGLAIVDTDHLQRMQSKLLRKKEIESGVPALDAEIKKSETRLAEFMEEEEKLLLEIAKGKEGRQQLLEELSNLSLELDGLSFEKLADAQRRLEMKDQPQISNEALIHRKTPPFGNDVSEPHISITEARSRGYTCAVPESVLAVQVSPEGVTPQSGLSTDAYGPHDVAESENEPSAISLSGSSGSAMDESIDSPSCDSLSLDQEGSKGHEILALEPNSTENSDDIRQVDHEESDNLDPECQALPEQSPFSNSGTPMDVIPDSGDESGMPSNQASRESSVSEAYEPPEPEANASHADSVYTPPFSPASPSPVESMEISMSPLDEFQRADEPLTEKIQGLDVQQPRIFAQNELQTEDAKHKFIPYTSPLKTFKAYRYHPKYIEDIQGGYRSLTYSHNIDPMKYICPFEAAGGVCNDRSCEFQHFRDMSLSDDKILVQMGSLREGKTAEDKDQYIAGLKQIINEMRRDKVKDFNTVATEIAAYRRRFLQDPSRILPL